MNIICFLFGHRLSNKTCLRCKASIGLPDFENMPNYPFPKMETPDSDSLVFQVPGAGYLAIGSIARARCGQSVGFSFGVSWGRNGYCGGVIGRTQAKRLAEHILKACEGIEESELDESFRRDKEMHEYFSKLNKTDQQ